MCNKLEFHAFIYKYQEILLYPIYIDLCHPSCTFGARGTRKCDDHYHIHVCRDVDKFIVYIQDNESRTVNNNNNKWV